MRRSFGNMRASDGTETRCSPHPDGRHAHRACWLGQMKSAHRRRAARCSERAVFQKMTAEERIGQLFLVTFTGTDTTDKSQIYDLIVNHHVGGVVLLAANDNFEAAPDTASGAYDSHTRSAAGGMEYDRQTAHRSEDRSAGSTPIRSAVYRDVAGRRWPARRSDPERSDAVCRRRWRSARPGRRTWRARRER